MYEIKNSKQVELSDRVRFRCIRCGKCCRNVLGSVIIESLDGWRMAKHLGITVADFYDKYTDLFFMEDVEFPIFALKTNGKENACIFLKGNRCTIQDAKPRTCKMYPFWIGPGETPEDFTYNLSTEQRHHPKGSLVKVKDWMRDNFTAEEKQFLAEDYKAMTEIAPLYNIVHRALKDNDSLLRMVTMWRYIFFETDEPFFPQFERNNRVLKDELLRIIHQNTSIG